MSKMKLRYFYFLILLLNGIFSFGNSVTPHLPEFVNSDYIISITIQHPKLEVKKSLIEFETYKDKIEVLDSEVENDEENTDHLPNTFNFFDTYFSVEIGANSIKLKKNRLTSCKHIDYLSSISSKNIIFCIFRI